MSFTVIVACAMSSMAFSGVSGSLTLLSIIERNSNPFDSLAIMLALPVLAAVVLTFLFERTEST